MMFSALKATLGCTLAIPVLSSALEGISDTTRNSLRAIAKRDLVSDILNDIEGLADCTGCETLLIVLKALAHTGNDAFTDVIIDVCETLGVEDEDVCEGAISLEGPILAHDLRQMTIGTKTSQLFCLTIFGLCQWPDVDTSFSLDLSTKPDTSRPSPSGKTPIQVIHISDIHVDLNYTVGASYNCTKNICCRPYQADDEPGVTDYPAGPFGNSECDSPYALEQSLYAAIQSLVPGRAFTIFTGDIIEGAVWLVTNAEVINDLNNATSKMASIGQVYPVMGNHDVSPVNSFPPGAVDTTITSQWAYDTLSSDWTPWIGATAASGVSSNYGSYSVVDSSGLKLISINTNFWYKQNFWMYEAEMESDPSSMLSWLVSELDAAENADQRVWLMGHMPMGSTDTFHDQSYYFDTIIQRYEATIAAVFYGHTHKDEFEISYSNYSNQDWSTATMMSYVAPALTPTSGNPTFRVYDVDPETFGIVDMHVYFANISSPTYQSEPVWELLYSVKDAYGSLMNYTDLTAELTPAFWHNLTALFESNDNVFQEYYARKTRNYDTSKCDNDCKTMEICQLRAAQAQYNCGTVSPGVNFKRGLETDGLEGGECDASLSIPIISAISNANGITALQTALLNVLGSDFLNATIPANYTSSTFSY